MTEFSMGADASCSDGPCGKLTRLIVDPETQAVTHLVIGPKHRGERGRLVPIDLVDAHGGRDQARPAPWPSSTSSIRPKRRICCPATPAIPRLQPALATLGGSARFRVWAWPTSARTTAQELATHDTVPMGEVDVRRGEPVFATDGEIGKIQGLVIDPSSRHVTHVLLEEGHLWGRKEVAIPISSVTRVDDVIRLTIDKQQVQDLPPTDVDHLET